MIQSERLSVVEANARDNSAEIIKLRNRYHSLANNIATLQAGMSSIIKTQETQSSAFTKHMDKEEFIQKQLYASMGELSGSISGIREDIHKALRERDEAIHDLDKQQAKMLAYATCVFTLLTIAFNALVKFLQ